MDIKTIIHDKYPDTEIHVCKDRLDDEVRGIVDTLHTMFDTAFSGTDEVGNRCTIRPSEIYSFYAEGQRVIALGETKRYTLSEKLYQLEKMLENLLRLYRNRRKKQTLNSQNKKEHGLVLCYLFW